MSVLNKADFLLVDVMTGTGAIRRSPTFVIPPKTGGVGADNPLSVTSFTTAVAMTVMLP